VFQLHDSTMHDPNPNNAMVHLAAQELGGCGSGEYGSKPQGLLCLVLVHLPIDLWPVCRDQPRPPTPHHVSFWHYFPVIVPAGLYPSADAFA
jgi:hypothetical protein